MSLAVTSTLVGLLHWVLPILACTWAIRSHKSRVQLVLLCAGAAVIAGLFTVIPLAQLASAVGEGFSVIPYQLGSMLMSSVIIGLFVGGVGVVVQTVAQRRPERA